MTTLTELIKQRNELEREINNITMMNQIILARQEETIPGRGIACYLEVNGVRCKFVGSKATAILITAQDQLKTGSSC